MIAVLFSGRPKNEVVDEIERGNRIQPANKEMIERESNSPRVGQIVLFTLVFLLLVIIGDLVAVQIVIRRVCSTSERANRYGEFIVADFSTSSVGVFRIFVTL